MPFRKGLSEHLKNIVYKYSLVNKPIKNSRHILYNYILAPTRRGDSFKLIIISKIIKII